MMLVPRPGCGVSTSALKRCWRLVQSGQFLQKIIQQCISRATKYSGSVVLGVEFGISTIRKKTTGINVFVSPLFT